MVGVSSKALHESSPLESNRTVPTPSSVHLGALAIGFAFAIPVRIGGRISAGEILAILGCLNIARHIGGLRLFRGFDTRNFAWLLLALTPWASFLTTLRISRDFLELAVPGILIGLSLAFLLPLLNSRAALASFVIGLGIGQLAFVFIAPLPAVSQNLWKFGFGLPAFLIVVALSEFVRGKFLYFGLGLITLISAATSTRLIMALAVGVGLYSAMPMRAIKQGVARSSRVWTVVIALAVAVAGVLAYDYLASSGALGEVQRDRYLTQSQGKFWLLGGARPDFLIAFDHLQASPFRGYGAEPSLAVNYDPRVALEAYGYAGLNLPSDLIVSRQLSGHSLALDAWIKGGLLAAIPFVYLVVANSSSLMKLASLRHVRSPLLFALLTAAAWDLLFSPFNMERRSFIVAAVIAGGVVSEMVWAQRRGLFRP